MARLAHGFKANLGFAPHARRIALLRNPRLVEAERDVELSGIETLAVGPLVLGEEHGAPTCR